MAVKYTIPMRDDFDLLWRADIDVPGYSGDVIQLTGVGRTAMVAEWNGDIDEPYTPIINSKVTLQFYNEGNVDIIELQNLQDMEAKVNIYRDNVLWWTGYIIPDGIQRNFRAFPYPVRLVAIDGLALLTDIPFQGVTNWPLPSGISNRSPLAFVRHVLFNSENLNNPLPIRWASAIESAEYNDDFFAGSMEWGADGMAWNNPDFAGDGLDQTRSCTYILENMVKSLGARFFQFGGKWHIIRINDISQGSYNWKEIDTTYGPGTPPSLTTGTEALSAGLNTNYYPFISEDHVVTNKPPLTDAVVTYAHYQLENIIPNGGFDRWSFSLPNPLLYWRFEDRPDDAPHIEQYESLRQDGYGNAVEVSNGLFLTPASDYAIFTLFGGLPVDANVLFKRFTWGFTILPLQGFPYTEYEPSNPDGQVIEWEDYPLKVRVSYRAKDKLGNIQTMYLNEYGYWQYLPTGGYLELTSHSKQQSGGNTIFKYRIIGNPLTGNTISFRYSGGGSGTEYVVNSSTSGNLYATLNDMLSNHWEMPVVVSKTVTSISTYEVEVEIIDDGLVSNDLVCKIVSGKDTILPGNWLPISVPNMKMGDIASIVFQGKGGNSEIIFPDPGELDGSQSETTGKMNIEFAVLPNQKYVLDDISFRVEDNNDVYQSVNTVTSKLSNRQNVELGISTSFSGFMLSNFMTSYNKSNEEFLVTDGKHISSLTGLLANAMMRFRYKPSQIFNGTIYTNGRDWKFHHMYMISAISNNLFLPMQSKYNIETCQVTLAVIEARDEENTFEEKHYASNEVIM